MTCVKPSPKPHARTYSVMSKELIAARLLLCQHINERMCFCSRTFFPLRVDPLKKRGKNEHDRVALLKVYTFTLVLFISTVKEAEHSFLWLGALIEIA